MLEVRGGRSQVFLALSDKVIVLGIFHANCSICVHSSIVLGAVLNVLVGLILPSFSHHGSLFSTVILVLVV